MLCTCSEPFITTQIKATKSTLFILNMTSALTCSGFSFCFEEFSILTACTFGHFSSTAPLTLRIASAYVRFCIVFTFCISQASCCTGHPAYAALCPHIVTTLDPYSFFTFTIFMLSPIFCTSYLPF